MDKYMRGIVYKIQLKNTLYIGSTEQTLIDREKKHNIDFKLYPHRKIYSQCIEEGVDKIICIWIADIEFNSTPEKRMIEEDYRKKMNATLNMIRCYRTEEEKKEQLKVNGKLYRETHKDQKKKPLTIEQRARKTLLQREFRLANRDAYNKKRKEKRLEKKLKSLTI